MLPKQIYNISKKWKKLERENSDLRIIEKGKLKQEVENPTNVTGGSKKSKGGFANKMNPNTEKAMRAMLDGVKQKENDLDKERE